AVLREVRAHVLPHDLAARRDFEDAAIRALGNHRVPVGQPLGAADVVTEEAVAFLSRDRVFPLLLESHRIQLEDPRVAAACGTNAVGRRWIGEAIASSSAVVKYQEIAGAG